MLNMIKEKLNMKGIECDITTDYARGGRWDMMYIYIDGVKDDTEIVREIPAGGFNVYDSDDEYIEIMLKTIDDVIAYYSLKAEKLTFVDGVLSDVLKSTDENIKAVGYHIDDNFNETVNVLYFDGNVKHINVSADSKQAILKDVITRLF